MQLESLLLLLLGLVVWGLSQARKGLSQRGKSQLALDLQRDAAFARAIEEGHIRRVKELYRNAGGLRKLERVLARFGPWECADLILMELDRGDRDVALRALLLQPHPKAVERLGAIVVDAEREIHRDRLVAVGLLKELGNPDAILWLQQAPVSDDSEGERLRRALTEAEEALRLIEARLAMDVNAGALALHDDVATEQDGAMAVSESCAQGRVSLDD